MDGGLADLFGKDKTCDLRVGWYEKYISYHIISNLNPRAFLQSRPTGLLTNCSFVFVLDDLDDVYKNKRSLSFLFLFEIIQTEENLNKNTLQMKRISTKRDLESYLLRTYHDLVWYFKWW